MIENPKYATEQGTEAERHSEYLSQQPLKQHLEQSGGGNDQTPAEGHMALESAFVCVEFWQGRQEVHQKLSCNRSQMPASLKHKPGYQPLFSVAAVQRYQSQEGTKNHGGSQMQQEKED